MFRKEKHIRLDLKIFAFLHPIAYIFLILICNIGAKPFNEDWAPKPFPGVTNTGINMPAVGGTAVNINITTNRIIKINPGIYGNNAAIWDGDSSLLNPTMKDRMKKANISIFRYPGGASSDHYHWDGNYPPYAISQGWDVFGWSWAVDTYEFLTLCEELNIPQKMFIANHGYCYYYSDYDGPKASYISNAVNLAADWVEYCNSSNNGSNPNGGTDWAAIRDGNGHSEPFNVKYWEIGNEIFGDWEVGYEPNGTIYGQHFVAFYDAMKAVDPSIYIGLVVNVDDGGAINWSRDALTASGVADRVDFLIHHDYFLWVGYNPGQDKTPEQILASANQIIDNKNNLDSLVRNYTTRTDITYTLSEYNTCLPANHHTVELTGGLFIAKALGLMAENGFHSALLWDVQNGWTAEGGDHAFTSKSHPGVPNYTPYPHYYPFYFYTRNFGEWLINSSSDDSDVHVFASKFTNGNIGIIIVNEAPVNHTASINLNINSGADINSWVLTGDSLTSMDISLNGQKSGYPAGGPSDVSAVPPYFTELYKVNPFFINLEKYSVTSLLINLDSKIEIKNKIALPSTIINEKNNLVSFQLEATSAPGSITNVTIDLSSVGGNSNAKMINISGDLFRYTYLIPEGTPKGTNSFPGRAVNSMGTKTTFEMILIIKSIVAVSEANAAPYQIINDIPNPVTFIVKAKSQWADVTNVIIDLSPIGGNSIVTMTNISGSDYYSCIYLIPQGIAGGNYNFLVTAKDKSNNIGTASIFFTIIDKILPSAPTNLTASADKEKVILTWEPSTDETGLAGYNVYRGINTGYYDITKFIGNKTTWEDTFIENGETYYYIVKAIDTDENESLPSNEEEVKIPVLTGLMQIRPNYIRIPLVVSSSEIYVEVMEDNS